MPSSSNNGLFTIFFSPSLRGASDSIRLPLESLLSKSSKAYLASQQVSDRDIVNALATRSDGEKITAHVLLESDYLYERKPASADSIWNSSGDREEHRQCCLQ